MEESHNDGRRRQRVRPGCADQEIQLPEFKKGERPAALFDLEKDPGKTVNLGDEPAYAAVRREMAELFHTQAGAALPPGSKSAAP